MTPTPTRVPNCPASHPDAPWIAPPDFAGYPASISAYLNAGGSTGGLRSILENASSINAQFGGLWSFDLTGDSDPETIVSIFDPLGPVFGPVPGGFLLIYGCFDQTAPLLYQDSGRPMLQVKDVGDFVGAGRGGEVAAIRSECGAHSCFDTFDVLGWDGAAFVSLMGHRLQMPSPTYSFVNLDADPAVEIEAVSGAIGSIGAGPPRTVTQVWDWNGAQYVQTRESFSPPEYRIHLVHDADDALSRGDLVGAVEMYRRVIDDNALRDWLLEMGVPKADDRSALSAYAWYRIMIADVRLGDGASAQSAFDRLSAEVSAGTPGDAYRDLAQVFWARYQASGSLGAACLAANAHANDDTGAIDGLNAFGYANRQYVAADMCPFVGP